MENLRDKSYAELRKELEDKWNQVEAKVEAKVDARVGLAKKRVPWKLILGLFAGMVVVAIVVKSLL